MHRAQLVGLTILVACGAFPLGGGAHESPAALGSKATVQGEVILRTPDSSRGLVYLRLRDAEERVWIFAVSPGVTSVSQDGKAMAPDALKEGAYVEVTLPRGEEGIPVAEAISVLPAPQPISKGESASTKR